MKLTLLFTLILLGSVLSAQTFVETSPIIPIEGVSYSSIVFSDVDGDGDQDVLITGRSRTPMLVPISWLYTNDGMGTFTEAPNTPFEGVEFCSVAFADIDGDNDQDVLISGRNISSDNTSKLYTNDGGNFTEVMNTPFEGVHTCSIAFADIDGDNDQDVLITGTNNSNIRVAKLYTNVGGTFTEVEDTVFEGVQFSSIAFADIDGDNDQDVIIAGQDISFEIVSKLYTNDGTGVFTEVMDTGIAGVEYGSIAFADIDGDNDLDLFIAGRESEDTPIAKLYTNDGGDFTEVMGASFEGVDFAAVAFADVDGDNDPDLMINGRNSSIARSTKLYTNDAGTFTELADNPFIQTTSGSVAFADVDGDNDQDLLVTGLDGSNIPITTIYANEWTVSTFEPVLDRLDFEFSPYPNPTRAEEININYLSSENTSLIAKIFDLNGRLLIQQQNQLGIGEQTFSIDIAALSKGTYTIQLSQGKRKGTRQFLIQ